MSKLSNYAMEHIHVMKECGFHKSSVIIIKGKTAMGYPYPVYPVYYGLHFIKAFPRYREAVNFRNWLWNMA